MKKTFKKQIILFAVIAVMMIFALVMPASAEDSVACPGMNGGGHLEVYLKDIVLEPTCTQHGYTRTICTYCNDAVVVAAKNFVDPTGHNDEVAYVYNEDSKCYDRVCTCQNDVCVRAGYDPVIGVTIDTESVHRVEKAEGYYLVEYVNEYESPDKNSPDHAASYLAEHYVANDSSTWVLNCTYEDAETSGLYVNKTYTSGEEATVNGAVAAPDAEYVDDNGTLKLYVKDGEEIPAYKGKLPIRGKDLTYGGYDFAGWAFDKIENGTKTYVATFTPDETVTVSGVFYNYNGLVESNGKTIPYGTTICYGELPTPVRESDQVNKYTFLGWTLDKNDKKIYGIKEEITLYYNTGIFAKFEETKNQYKVEFVDFYGKAFEVDGDYLVKEGVTCGANLIDDIAGISPEAFDVPRDKKLAYTRDEKTWVIKKVNGKDVVTHAEMNPRSFSLPGSVLVKNTETGVNETIVLGNGETITIAPKYNAYVVNYTFKVSIKAALFRDEDVYEDNNIFKSDILDKFIIQVRDQNGVYVVQNGRTNGNGEFWFTSEYRDTLIITASMQNNKYYGEHILDLESCETAADIERIEQNGIVILPAVTQEWLDGLRSCDCICHSILSPIVIRIYNIIYKIFGIEYVCCDDLFIVHGKVLSYAK